VHIYQAIYLKIVPAVSTYNDLVRRSGLPWWWWWWAPPKHFGK